MYTQYILLYYQNTIISKQQFLAIKTFLILSQIGREFAWSSKRIVSFIRDTFKFLFLPPLPYDIPPLRLNHRGGQLGLNPLLFNVKLLINLKNNKTKFNSFFVSYIIYTSVRLSQCGHSLGRFGSYFKPGCELR